MVVHSDIQPAENALHGVGHILPAMEALLQGTELDLAVARAEIAAGQVDVKISDGGVPTIHDAAGRWQLFRPSMNWAHVGPIIGRERICIMFETRGNWSACVVQADGNVVGRWNGDTPLVAAMRAYVASRRR